MLIIFAHTQTDTIEKAGPNEEFSIKSWESQGSLCYSREAADRRTAHEKNIIVFLFTTQHLSPVPVKKKR